MGQTWQLRSTIPEGRLVRLVVVPWDSERIYVSAARCAGNINCGQEVWHDGGLNNQSIVRVLRSQSGDLWLMDDRGLWVMAASETVTTGDSWGRVKLDAGRSAPR